MPTRSRKQQKYCNWIVKAALLWVVSLCAGLVYLSWFIWGVRPVGLHPEQSSHPEVDFRDPVPRIGKHGEGGWQTEMVGKPEVGPAEEGSSSRVTGLAVLPLEPSTPLPEVDNAPRPPPRQGEFERRSEVPDVLPGVSLGHQHGMLGLLPDGSLRIQPTPLPSGGLSSEERRDAHRGFCFNSRKSDSLPLDRKQSDVRSGACKQLHQSYPAVLPSASVVMVFHNENLSVLLRSIHSVLNHSPPHLLVEVILVDDASVPVDDRFYQKHWNRLQDELTEYCRFLPKVMLVRLKERRGLMVARMEGVWRAKGQVVIFLDSHIEATPGWIEPLLARIHADPSVVVVPSIDSIGNEDFNYAPGGGLGVLGFSWTLGQVPSWADMGPDGSRPAKSPVMAGGLFASDRRWFLKLGGYDPEMRLYGGEEMEIGFRTWMCGGRIEYIPCSHVGHVFRTGAFWQGQVYKVPGEEISRNKLRAAEVWMDEYKALVRYATAPLPPSLPLGDLEPRRELRRKLKCKDFAWYLKEVAPNMFVPHLSEDARGGALQNRVKQACVDSLGRTVSGSPLGAYPCHGQHGTQALVMDSDGMVRLPVTGYKSCAVAAGNTASIGSCDGGQQAKWRHLASQQFVSMQDGKCLEFVDQSSDSSPYSLSLLPCVDGKSEQKWFWMP